MLAEILGWPQGDFCLQKWTPSRVSNRTVVRVVYGGLETIAFPLPAVITTDLRLNEPRYVSLPEILKARKNPLKEIPIHSLGLDLTPKFMNQGTQGAAQAEGGTEGRIGRGVGQAASRRGLSHLKLVPVFFDVARDKAHTGGSNMGDVLVFAEYQHEHFPKSTLVAINAGLEMARKRSS